MKFVLLTGLLLSALVSQSTNSDSLITPHAQEIEIDSSQTVISSSINPTAEEILKVYNYLKNGQLGAILYDSRLTSKVVGTEPIDSVTEVKLGEEVSIWLNFILPRNYKDENYTIVVQRGPIGDAVFRPVLSMRNNSGTLHYKLNRRYKAKRPGKYSVKIYCRDVILKEYNFEVVR